MLVGGVECYVWYNINFPHLLPCLPEAQSYIADSFLLFIFTTYARAFKFDEDMYIRCWVRSSSFVARRASALLATKIASLHCMYYNKYKAVRPA